MRNSHAFSMSHCWSFSEDIITSKVKRTLLIPSHTTCEFWTSRKCSGLMKLTYRVNILLAGSDTQLPLHRHLCSSLEAFTIPSACSATLYAGETSMTFGAWTFKIFKHSPGSALKPRENRPLLVTATPWTISMASSSSSEGRTITIASLMISSCSKSSSASGRHALIQDLAYCARLCSPTSFQPCLDYDDQQSNCDLWRTHCRKQQKQVILYSGGSLVCEKH